MKRVVFFLALCASVPAFGQKPAAKAPNPLDNLSFMMGDWSGKQNFETGGSPAMVGDATDRVQLGIADKYLCEMLSTTLFGRKPTDTRHFISYDKQSGKYTAWWFNDTSTHPSEFAGDLVGKKLVLLSNASGAGPVLRATYESPADNTLTFLLEIKQSDSWTKLFLTTYTKKAATVQP
jgi:hypothetical protein